MGYYTGQIIDLNSKFGGGTADVKGLFGDEAAKYPDYSAYYDTPDGARVFCNRADGSVYVRPPENKPEFTDEQVKAKVDELRKIERVGVNKGKEGLAGYSARCETREDFFLTRAALGRMGYGKSMTSSYVVNPKDYKFDNYVYDPSSVITVKDGGTGNWKNYRGGQHNNFQGKYNFTKEVKLGGHFDNQSVKVEFNQTTKSPYYNTPDGGRVIGNSDGSVTVIPPIFTDKSIGEDVKSKVGELRKLERDLVLGGNKGFKGQAFNCASAREAAITSKALGRMGYTVRYERNDNRRNADFNSYVYDPSTTIKISAHSTVAESWWKKYK